MTYVATNSENWPQGNGNKLTLGIKDQLYLKQSRWCKSDHQWSISRWLSTDCIVSVCLPPPLQPIKALAHWLSLGRSRPLDRHPPSPTPSWQHPKSSKRSLLPTLPLYWLLSSKQLDRTSSYSLLICNKKWGCSYKKHWWLWIWNTDLVSSIVYKLY